MTETCTFCGEKLVRPMVPKGALVAVVGTEPGREEMKHGIPLVGETGKVFRAELLRQGIVLGRLWRGNLWLHPIPSTADDRRQELDWHKQQLIKALRGIKAVMLCGAANAQAFLGSGIMAVSGLEVKIDELPSSIETVTMSVNPAQMLYGPVGELRLSVEKFAIRAREWL